MLYHLIYISHATHSFSQDELEKLLISARRNNKKGGITGMLLYLNDKFIQVLEGEKKEVKKLLSLIELDPRHRKVSVLLEGSTRERVFKTWSMGYKKLGYQDFKAISGYEDVNEFFERIHVNDDSSPLLIFLRLFYQKNMNDLPELA